jgi:hypothetical protein
MFNDKVTVSAAGLFLLRYLTLASYRQNDDLSSKDFFWMKENSTTNDSRHSEIKGKSPWKKSKSKVY